jgi:FkbM family methyltransferase
MKLRNTLHAIITESVSSVRLGGNWRSRLRLMTDFLLSHLLFALPPSMAGRERKILTRSGHTISYRLNRGDLQGIREVWCNEVYRPSFVISPGALLDFGANIGLTSLWMATQFHFTRILAVEPNPDNAALTAKNLAQNGIAAQVIEAAIGPKDGTAHFKTSAWSNLGQLADEGVPVRMVSAASLLREHGVDSVGLAKVDIEGGEQALFLGPSEWLDRVGALIVEFHPNLVDYPLLTKTVASHGFDYIPATEHCMDSFVRSAPAGGAAA